MKSYSCKTSFLFVLILFLPFFGCSSMPHKAMNRSHEMGNVYEIERVEALAKALNSLSGKEDSGESFQLARKIVFSAEELTYEYKLVPSPLFHNILVNMRFKERGLCYQWAEDILERINEDDYETFSFHRAIARRGSLLWEHNAIVVTGNNQVFEDGLIIDAWRNSGKVFWEIVRDDKYEWEPWLSDKSSFTSLPAGKEEASFNNSF